MLAVSYEAGEVSKSGRLRSIIAVTPNVTETQYNSSNLIFDSSLSSATVASLVGGFAPLTKGYTYSDKSIVVRVTDSQDFERIEE